MLSLKSFIEAIQDSVLNASDALMSKNMEVMNQYFEVDADDSELHQKLDDAIAATGDVVDPTKKRDRETLRTALRSLKSLRSSLGENASFSELLKGGDLTPKTVTLTFPTKGSDGTVTMKEVYVPLITLVPVRFSQIDEMKIQADLELDVQDNEIQISLGKSVARKKGLLAGKDKPTEGKEKIGLVEITLKPQEVSDGMQMVIDSYEKVLKAQLPN